MPVCMSDGAVDEQVPQSDEHQHGGVLHAIGEATTDQCRSDDREGQLVCGEKRLYNKHKFIHTSTNSVYCKLTYIHTYILTYIHTDREIIIRE